MMQCEVYVVNNEINIIYYGDFYKNNSKEIYIVCGFGNEWKYTQKKIMKKIDDYYMAKIETRGINEFNFCFCDENKVWDNNNGQNYSYIIENEIKDNSVLLISEIQDKVVLPYTAEEVFDIIRDKSNEFKTAEEVVDRYFTKEFSIYKNQYAARFREAMELIVDRENMTKLDGFNLGAELINKRYLHPAIISACRNLDELNVYLDCMDKNELDDFKIFDIKYELYPIATKNSLGFIIKSNNIVKKFINYFKEFFNKAWADISSIGGKLF